MTLVAIRDCARMIGISARTLSRWKEQHVVLAARDDGGGRGRGAWLTEREIELARFVGCLTAAGMPMRLVRPIVERLRADPSRPVPRSAGEIELQAPEGRPPLA